MATDFANLKELAVGAFGPAASEAELALAEGRLRPFTLTDELITLYRTFDGWVLLKDECEFYSLARALEVRSELTLLLDEHKGAFPPSLLPLLYVGSTYFFAVLECARAPKGIVVSICYADGDHEYSLEHQSVVAFAESIMKNGGIQFSTDKGSYTSRDLPTLWR